MPSLRTAGREASFVPTSNPTPRSCCAGPSASGRSRSPHCCCSSRHSNSAPWSCERTSSTTFARCRATRELEARLSHLFWRTGRGLRPELVEYGPLVLNLETYQASVTGKPLSLTFMEYELLKFLATHPGKVFTRETLLSRVWGYEYYGGARTVDVHIRRLRAKLGEEQANLISTVRSVGYRFGQSRWAL